MKPVMLSLMALGLAAPAAAQETREMGAHVHGVSTAEIAMEQGTVSIDMTSPGMDIVGFEHAPGSPEDRRAIDAALRSFLTPENVVTLPESAGCALTEVLAHLHGEEHEDHAEEMDAHVEGDHDHGEEHAEGEDQGREGAVHSAFHVRYVFACEDEDALTEVAFPFFDAFEAAGEIEVQYVTEGGAGSAELTADARTIGFQ